MSPPSQLFRERAVERRVGESLRLERFQEMILSWNEVEADVRPAVHPLYVTVQLELFVQGLVAGEHEAQMLAGVV